MKGTMWFLAIAAVAYGQPETQQTATRWTLQQQQQWEQMMQQQLQQRQYQQQYQQSQQPQQQQSYPESQQPLPAPNATPLKYEVGTQWSKQQPRQQTQVDAVQARVAPLQQSVPPAQSTQGISPLSGPSWTETVDKLISAGVLQLGLRLAETVERDSDQIGSPTNVVFSPVNVAAALALVLAGSGGTTFQEIARVLGIAAGVDLTAANRDLVHKEFGRFLSQLESHSSIITNGEMTGQRSAMTNGTGNQVVVASGLFVQREFEILQRFADIAETYRAEVITADFSRHPAYTKDLINTWFAQRTLGRIKSVLAEPPPVDTRVLIASALYFNGEWETPFPIEATMVRPFLAPNANGTKDQFFVHMMTNNVDLPFFEDKELRCRMMALPYKGRDVSMYLILPDGRELADLRELESKLTADSIERMIASSKESPIIFSLPRMKLERSISLRKALETLGVSSMFDAQLADLSQISGGPRNGANGAATEAPSLAQSTGEFAAPANAGAFAAPDAGKGPQSQGQAQGNRAPVGPQSAAPARAPPLAPAPVAAPAPSTSNAPAASQPPTASQNLTASQPPAASQPSAASKKPAASQTPVASQPSGASQPPAASHNPAASHVPVSTPAPTPAHSSSSQPSTTPTSTAAPPATTGASPHSPWARPTTVYNVRENENTLFFSSRISDLAHRKALTDLPRLYADDVLHKVEVEVTETGTVAAAATAITLNRDGSSYVMRFTRPFIFFIRDNRTGLVLFYGSVVRPTPEWIAPVPPQGYPNSYPAGSRVPPQRPPPRRVLRPQPATAAPKSATPVHSG